MQKGSTLVGVLAGLTIALVGMLALLPNLQIDDSSTSLGSVVTGSEYESAHYTSSNASSTAANFAKSGYGSLASVVITQPATAGFVNIYNATTTTGYATSTGELLTAFDSSNDVAGTYMFDLVFEDGLQIDISAGFDGEYTITWR